MNGTDREAPLLLRPAQPCGSGKCGVVPQSTGESEYSIAAVSKLTGVSCHALRVWERRYGFPVPHRSASGHRRYGIDQVLILRRVSEQSQAGRSIGDLIADLRAGKLTVDAGQAASLLPCQAANAAISEFM